MSGLLKDFFLGIISIRSLFQKKITILLWPPTIHLTYHRLKAACTVCAARRQLNSQPGRVKSRKFFRRSATQTSHWCISSSPGATWPAWSRPHGGAKSAEVQRWFLFSSVLRRLIHEWPWDNSRQPPISISKGTQETENTKCWLVCIFWGLITMQRMTTLQRVCLCIVAEFPRVQIFCTFILPGLQYWCV